MNADGLLYLTLVTFALAPMVLMAIAIFSS